MSQRAAGRKGARRHRGNEGQAMKKMRIMVLALMVMAMAAGLLSGPGTAYAEGSTPEIVLGAGEIAKATSTARNYTVWFGRYNDSDWGNGPVQWRVLSGGGSADPDDGTNLPVSGTGEALLISKDLLDVDCYFKQDCSSNQWAGSDAQAWCTAFWNSSNWLTAAEKRAVNATTVNENNSSGPFYCGGYYDDYYSAAPLNGEHIFFLSAREADKLFTGDSDRQAQKVSVNKSWWWWLRSPLTRNGQFSSDVNSDGWVRNDYVDNDLGARPAFNLNLSSVLFSSLIQSNQYKLTLADSNRTIGIQPGAAITRDSATQITVPYTKDSGSNHVSLLITGKNVTWSAKDGWSSGAAKLYYETQAVSSTSGTVSFTLPDSLKDKTCGTDYAAYLLAVDENGEHESDYASAPVGVTLPALPRVEISLGAGALTAGNKVWFGSYSKSPVLWRVLQSGDGKALLISNDILARTEFNLSTSEGNAWSGSKAQTWCRYFKKDKNFTVPEQAAILATTVEETGNYTYNSPYFGIFDYTPASLNNEHFFFLSAKEAVDLFAGDNDRKAYGESNFWWLRSPLKNHNDQVGIVDNDGWMYQYPVVDGNGARPAFNLNLSSVLFVSAAEGGKSIAVEDGTSSGAKGAGVYNIPSGSKTDWKLTLKDDSRSGFASEDTYLYGAEGWPLGILYSGAQTGTNEYVSILICDSTGAAQYYGSFKHSAASGTAEFVLPSGMPAGNYTVKLFNEQKNGKHESDYASDFVSIPLQVLRKKISYEVTFKVVNGYWNTGDHDNAEKTVTLTGWEGDTLKLASDDIPAAGNKPIDNTYKAGGWDTTPSTETAITQDTTYTYTYAKKGSISAKVTFKVVNGSWNDETLAAEHSVTLEGYEGDTLKLTAAQIPGAGSKPAEHYKAGSWDTTPSTSTSFANGSTTTYTYTYVQQELISYDVIFKVKNGEWDLGGTADQKVTLSRYENEDLALKLKEGDIPAVGNKPNEHYKAGSWDTTPSTDTAISENKVYTYTYAAKSPISATVVFKVFNGGWNDETLTAEHTVTLSGYEGDALKLTAAQIPAVGTKPDDTYKAGSWDTEPSTETAFANGSTTTYTYTYAKKDSITATVVFKVVNGGWNDETLTGDQTVTLTGLEGDALKLTVAQIPTAGNKPNDTYKAGSWDTTPSTETAFANGSTTTYTYTYAAKDAINQTVTFKVVNGSWDDGNAADITVTLTGFEGDTLKLAAAQIPAVGNKPADTYKAGAWDVTPSTETAITAPTTYTYSYAPKDGISQIVTFKVVNGSWDDGTAGDKTITLTGHEGDTLKLTANQIPAVGSKPADTYKAGAWDVAPSTATAITAPTTYTYTYAPKDGISQTVTFKVVNGSWDDGTASDKTVTLTGHEGDTLKLTADQIPAVGNKPAANYQAGSWDVTPSTETIITGPTAYTYTYAPVTSYTTTSGEGQEYRINSNDDLEFIVKCSVNDELTFPNFRSAALDGQTLGTADYDTAQGSLIFTLKAAKATTLALGTHTLTFTFTDGTATATFTVKPVAGSFEDVAVPSDTFTFRKEWQGSSEKSIDFTLYKIDGSVYHHGFDKKVVSNREWRYNAWFSSPAACYVIEEPIPGYITKYVNVGVYAGITDRCCDGGTIINKKIPKTGDEAPLLLWACCAVIGVIGVTAGVVTYNKMRKNTKK